MVRILHGVGPMSTLEGIQRAYSWQYLDKQRTRRGGRITAEQFRDLEAGKYGEVAIVDYEAYCARYEHPLYGALRASEALTDPVLKARLGFRTEEYVLAHAGHARRWRNEHDGSDPLIISVEGASNCSYGSPSYGYRQIEDGYAVAHLVSVSRLFNLCHQDGESLVADVDLHEWYDGVRLVAIRSGYDLSRGISPGPDPERLLRTRWRDLLILMKKAEEVGFRALMQVGNEWFTQFPKRGDGMDNREPEYHVTSLSRVGEPVSFRTTIGGYHGFFRYGISEVRAIAPIGANAYEIVGDVRIEYLEDGPPRHVCSVQFYRAVVDRTQRLVRADKLRHDYDKMMELLGSGEA